VHKSIRFGLAACALALAATAGAQNAGRAEYDLARQYSGQTGERVDLEKAFAHMERAARQGHLAAQVELAFLHHNGNHKVPRDQAAAFQWFRKAAGQGSLTAHCMLGDYYKHGLGGVRQDHGQAVKYFQRVAATKDKCAPRAQYELYVAHESGNGARKDLEAATAWLKKSADAGHPQAQATLGRNHDKGYGVPRDAQLAKKWLLKSREGVAPHDYGDEEHEHGHEGHGAHRKTRAAR
jgi:TPR repeat protein